MPVAYHLHCLEAWQEAGHLLLEVLLSLSTCSNQATSLGLSLDPAGDF